MDDAVNSSHGFWNSQSVDSSVPTSDFTLGMSSFDVKERHRFGESLRLSMALIKGKPASTRTPCKALPHDASSIAQRLKSLTQDITSHLADQLELLVRFDSLKGWERGGAKSCAAWMNLELGIGLQLALEYLRVGRNLRNLPVVTALFRAGKLTWSKVRVLTRVADEANESLLCHAALDASVSQVEKLCKDYRWQDDEQSRANEREQALKQWEARSFQWDNCRNGNVRISLSLPPYLAQAFLSSVEYSLAQLEPSSSSADTSMTQRRADAAMLMAENNLQSAGRDTATADRYQVIVSVDAAELSNDARTASDEKVTPTKRASIVGASMGISPLARDTARRLACDCSISAIISDKGEPIDIGQKTRIWPKAMARAIRARDKSCVWPGCTQTRHLHIHHIKHWVDGGTTSVDNAATLCSHHHTLLHEGGYRIKRVANDTQHQHEHFVRQTVDGSDNVWEVERRLRNSPESFDAERRVSPETFRYRIIDSEGRDVVGKKQNTRVFTKQVGCSYVDNGIAEPVFP